MQRDCDIERYYCRKCGLEFDSTEITAEDEDGRDLCPACGKPLTEYDMVE